jgi:glycosyltransferase involved in cell wall biosynthesis
MPKVSVIMSTYNDAKFLPQSVESVLGQSFGDFEFLIVDDASPDNTKSILERYGQKDSRIIHWTNQTNLGLTKNLNTAIQKARGEYIARLDSDDAWSDANKLKKQIDFLEQNRDYCLVGSWAEAFSDDTKKRFTIRYPASDSQIRGQLLWHNCFVHSSIMARKQNILTAGGYDLNQQYIEDYALWLRLGLESKFANLPEIMVRYRINSVGITRKKNQEQIRNILPLIKSYKGKYKQYGAAVIKWHLQYLLSKLN